MGTPSPSLGNARGVEHPKTLRSVVSMLRSICDFRGDRLLDVGCGNGTFTRELSEHYQEVHGIDVQQDNLRAFREHAAGDAKFNIHDMSASEMSFEDGYFDTIVSIEVFEHIADDDGAARECARVLRRGGELVMTVPNRWFPFETHGMRIGSWEKQGRIPLLTWIPPLHDRFGMARVYTVRALDALFCDKGFEREEVRYLWPTFEHGGNPLQPLLRPLFPLMRRMESSPLAMFGTSVVVKYRRR